MVTDDVKRSLCSVMPNSFMATEGSSNLKDYTEKQQNYTFNVGKKRSCFMQALSRMKMFIKDPRVFTNCII